MSLTVYLMAATAAPRTVREMLADLPHRKRTDDERRAIGRAAKLTEARIRARKRRLVDSRVERDEHGHVVVVTYADGTTVDERVHRRSDRRGHALRTRVRAMYRRHVTALDALAGDAAAKRACRPADPSLRYRRMVGDALAARVRRDEQTRDQAATKLPPMQFDVPPPLATDVESVLDAPRPGPAAGVAFTVA